MVGCALSFGPNALGGLLGWSRGLLLLRSIEYTILPAGVPDITVATIICSAWHGEVGEGKIFVQILPEPGGSVLR